MDIKQLYKLYSEHPVLTTDSRSCPEGAVFFALHGASFDGNKFAQAALDKGCRLAVVDDPAVASDPRCLLVDDTLQALQALAREHRRQYDMPMLAITGTNGKTTTKELTAAVLSERHRVLFTQANYNNDIGVPKTLLGLGRDHDMAVIEMGASHPGDIRRLVETAEPTCGLITNVGMAHIAGFGSLDGVAKTKGELYDYLRQAGRGPVFIDGSSPLLMGMAHGLDTVVYGPEGTPGAMVEGRVASCQPMLHMEWRANKGAWHTVKSHLIGAYNLQNLLAAATVGLHFGVGEEAICHALEAYVPSNNRSQMVRTEHNTLIVDAYNANPTSMAAAIDNLRQMDAPHKMAIIGDMGELGDASAEAHQRIADMLADCHLDEAWLIGPEFAKTTSAHRKLASVDEAKQLIAHSRPEGRCILVKGSHSTRLYELPEML